MEHFEQILKGLGITKKTKHHNYDYLYNQYATIWNKAIEAAAESAKVVYDHTEGYSQDIYVVDNESILKLKV